MSYIYKEKYPRICIHGTFWAVSFLLSSTERGKKSQQAILYEATRPSDNIYTPFPLDPCVIPRPGGEDGEGGREGEARARLNHLTAAITLEFIPISI